MSSSPTEAITVEVASKPEDGTDQAGKKRPYTCNACSKAFKRSEHCIRHQRSHTRDKPFSCRYCLKRYARKDLVVRHERTLHADQSEALDADPIHRRASISSTQQPVGAVVQARPLPEIRKSSFQQPQGTHQLSQIIGTNGQVLIDTHTRNGSSSHGTTDFFDNSSGQPQMANRVESLELARQDFGILDGTLHSYHVSSKADTAVAPLPSTHSSQLDRQQQILGAPSGSTLDQNSPDLDHFGTLDFFALFPHTLDAEHPTTDVLRNVSAVDWPQGHDFSSMLHHPGIGSFISGSATPVNGVKQSPREPPPSTWDKLPRITKEPPEKVATLPFTEPQRVAFLRDLESRAGSGYVDPTEIPNARLLQKFLSSYVECFHRHLPMIHMASFDVDKVPSPLLGAMCAIGALFRLERKAAASLHRIVERAIQSYVQIESGNVSSPHAEPSQNKKRTNPHSARPIWVAQSFFLLAFYSVFSGDAGATGRATERLGFLSNEFRFRALLVLPRSPMSYPSTWSQWVERETSKRLLYAIFIVSHLLVVTYGVAPGISMIQELEIEMPDEERFWKARTAEEWRHELQSRPPSARSSINDALARLMYGKQAEVEIEGLWDWSPFAVVIVIHAVSVRMWHIMQSTQSFSLFALDAATQESMRTTYLNQLEIALERCHFFLTRERSDIEHTWDESEGPLMFNSLALLRMAYCRAFTGVGTFDRSSLINDNAAQVSASIQAFVLSKQERGDFITKSVIRAFDGLLTPLKAGPLIVRKTAALSWSIEHALAAWDCALLFTKWVHAMEKNQKFLIQLEPLEIQTLENLQGVLEQTDDEYDDLSSMAAQATWLWASFFDDTWVWGITPRMGLILRELAHAYDRDLNGVFSPVSIASHG